MGEIPQQGHDQLTPKPQGRFRRVLRGLFSSPSQGRPQQITDDFSSHMETLMAGFRHSLDTRRQQLEDASNAFRQKLEADEQTWKANNRQAAHNLFDQLGKDFPTLIHIIEQAREKYMSPVKPGETVVDADPNPEEPQNK